MESHKNTSFMAHFLKGEAVSAFWGFSTKGVGLLNTFLTITSLTLYQYGVFQLLLSVAGLSSDFLNIGGGVVSNEISRAVGEKREADAKRIFIEYTIVRIIIAIALWAGVFFGAEIFFKSYSQDFIHDTRIISFLFITEAIFMIIKTLCLVKLKFGIVGARSTINKLVQFGILVYFFAQGNLGLQALIWSVIIASAVSVVAVLIPFLKVYFDWKNVAVPAQGLLWGIFKVYGKWDITRQIGNRITSRIKPWLIKIFIGTEAVAVFSIAEMIVSTLQDVLPSKTLQSLVPLWIKDKELSVKMFSYGVKYFVLLGAILGVCALIVVPPVVHTFFSKYNNSLPLFYFMIFNLPIFAAGILIGNYIIAFRKQKFLLFHQMLRNVLTLLIILCTLPFIGLWGLALEYVFVPLIMAFITYIYTKRRSPGFHFDTDIIFAYKEEDNIILAKAFSIVKSWPQKVKRLFE